MRCSNCKEKFNLRFKCERIQTSILSRVEIEIQPFADRAPFDILLLLIRNQ